MKIHQKPPSQDGQEESTVQEDNKRQKNKDPVPSSPSSLSSTSETPLQGSVPVAENDFELDSDTIQSSQESMRYGSSLTVSQDNPSVTIQDHSILTPELPCYVPAGLNMAMPLTKLSHPPLSHTDPLCSTSIPRIDVPINTSMHQPQQTPVSVGNYDSAIIAMDQLRISSEAIAFQTPSNARLIQIPFSQPPPPMEYMLGGPGSFPASHASHLGNLASHASHLGNLASHASHLGNPSLVAGPLEHQQLYPQSSQVLSHPPLYPPLAPSTTISSMTTGTSATPIQ